MKVAAINGSPKAKGSVSGKIIGKMESIIGTQIKTYHAVTLTQGETAPGTLAEILGSDVLLIVFPLYVDSLPAPLIELLTRLDAAADMETARPRVFAIVNCGFIEPKHNVLALEMIAHFAARTGMQWGYGLGIGGGGMLSSLGENWEKGPASGIYGELQSMARAIQNGETRENKLTEPKFPRFVPRTIYEFFANNMWKSAAKKNGVRNLRARPYVN